MPGVMGCTRQNTSNLLPNQLANFFGRLIAKKMGYEAGFFKTGGNWTGSFREPHHPGL